MLFKEVAGFKKCCCTLFITVHKIEIIIIWMYISKLSKQNCSIRHSRIFGKMCKVSARRKRPPGFYFPTPPHNGKPVVLMQIAVKLTVEYETTRLVTVDVPKDSKNRLGLPSGRVKPDSISRGIIDDWSTGLLITSLVGSLDLKFKHTALELQKKHKRFFLYRGSNLLICYGKE